MPKDFQISQYDLPIVSEGTVALPGGHVVGLERAHLEEDTGKSTHVGGDGRITGADHSLVDYNRAGVPLLEIVSRPHVRTPEQARQYVTELRSILVAAGVSDGKMEEGSLRVDANVSVRPVGSRRPRHPLRDQEPQLDPQPRPGHRVRGRPPGPAPRRGRPGRAADPALERGVGAHLDDALEGGGRRLPVLPRARPAARSTPTRRGSSEIGAALPPMPAAPARAPGRRPPA